MSSPAQQFYGRWARLYDPLARFTPGIGSLRERAADALRLDPGDTVVEMGCGTGANLPYLREQVGPEGRVVGVDFTGPMLARARSLVAEFDNVDVVQGDATAPPLAGPVDGVLATFVVGMLGDPGAGVGGWCDLVRPGGHVVLVDAALSDHPRAAPLNALLRAVTVLSTPPTLQIRYEDSPHDTLRTRVQAAHDALRARSDAHARETHLGGIVRLAGGRVAGGRAAGGDGSPAGESGTDNRDD